MKGSIQAIPLEIGVYKMAVTFAQGQDFVDYLSVEDPKNAVFTVPGSFTSRVKLMINADQFSFMLKAREGSRDLVLNFRGRSTNDGNSLSGEITEPVNNSIIGKFKGVKLYEARQDCGDYLIPYQ